jgi:hypothetical protein
VTQITPAVASQWKQNAQMDRFPGLLLLVYTIGMGTDVSNIIFETWF